MRNMQFFRKLRHKTLDFKVKTTVYLLIFYFQSLSYYIPVPLYKKVPRLCVSINNNHSDNYVISVFLNQNCLTHALHLVKAENVLTTYSTPGRASVSNSVIVEDTSYDGFKDHSQLTRSGGLWMLTDGEYGLTNFKVNSISLEGISLLVSNRSELKYLSRFKLQPHQNPLVFHMFYRVCF